MTLEYECFRILSMAPTMPSGDGLPSNGGADRDMLLARAKLLCDRRGWELSAGIGGGRTSSVFDVVTADGVRAVKIFRPHGFKGANGERRRRYLAVMVRRLIDCDFPYLTKIEEGEDFADTFYIKMRREQGRRLSDVLTLVPVNRIRDIVRQIAAAAHVLEQRGIFHRDLTCENILISEDFTHSVLIDLDYNINSVFSRYSSPELAFGLEKYGPKLWQGLTFYQLGALLHDLIMGKRLYEELLHQYALPGGPLAHAIATRPPVIENDDVPQDLVLLARRALEKDLTQRLATVGWRDFL